MPRATPPLLKRLNERTVLEAIRSGAPISRAEISRRAGISKPTVSLALRSLLDTGLGDALSNLSALADWELAERERGERVDGLAAALARSGAESLLHVDGGLWGDDFLTTLAQALILGGLAMAVAGSSRPCSGADHEVAHAMDALHPGCANHGEQVAIGALFASFLRDDPVLAALDASLRRHGIPRVPGDIGLCAEQFTQVVERAPATRPERYTILEHLDMDRSEIRRRVDAFIEAFAG